MMEFWNSGMRGGRSDCRGASVVFLPAYDGGSGLQVHGDNFDGISRIDKPALHHKIKISESSVDFSVDDVVEDRFTVRIDYSQVRIKYRDALFILPGVRVEADNVFAGNREDVSGI